MIFLALDIDGVLHNVGARTDANDPTLKPFAYLSRLEAVLRGYPNVRVVIASDWQRHHTLEELRAFFSADLRERIVGVSGRHLGDAAPGNRQRDVERYFAEQGLSQAVWCAIDDDEQNYYPNAAFVLCADGFRETEECMLRAVLDRIDHVALEERNRLDNADIPEPLRRFLVEDETDLGKEIRDEAFRLGVSEATINEWIAQFAQQVGIHQDAAWWFLTQELPFFDKPRVPLDVIAAGDWDAVLFAYESAGHAFT